MTYRPQAPLPENINRSNEHPLFSFFSLIVMVGVVALIVFFVLVIFSKSLAKNVPMATEHKYLYSYFSKDSKNKSNEFNELTNELWLASTGDPTIKFHPSVIPGKPNAMILPGGKIFLTDQFLQQTKSENELSFVLCHELGHFFHRHTIAGLVRQVIVGLFQMVTGSNNFSSGFTGLTQLFVNSSFSRSQEIEADEFALSCLNSKYGHVGSYSHFFEKIKKTEKGIQNKYFRSHPISQERIEHLENILVKSSYTKSGELIPFSYKK